MKYQIQILLLALLVLMLLSSSASAAMNAPWQILVWSPINHNILAVTSEGIVDTWELPDGVQDIQLSPSVNYAAISFVDPTNGSDKPYTDEIFLFDMQTRECCKSVLTKESFLSKFPDGYDAIFRMGGFNDEGTLLAVNYSYATPETSEYILPQMGIAVIDVTTGEIVAMQSTPQRYAMWLAEGVATYPAVQAPPGMSPSKYIEYQLSAWNVLTDETVLTENRVPLIPYYDLQDVGDVLSTGERIVSSFLSTPDSLDFAYVLYSFDESAYPVWFEPVPILDPLLGIPRDRIARWITDGKYIYNRTLAYHFGEISDTVQILSRSGDVQQLELPANDFFLTGTPNGWLALRKFSDQPILIHYIYEDGTLQSEEIVTFERDMRLLKKPLLGDSLINPEAFPAVAPPVIRG